MALNISYSQKLNIENSKVEHFDERIELLHALDIQVNDRLARNSAGIIEIYELEDEMLVFTRDEKILLPKSEPLWVWRLRSN